MSTKRPNSANFAKASAMVYNTIPIYLRLHSAKLDTYKTPSLVKALVNIDGGTTCHEWKGIMPVFKDEFENLESRSLFILSLSLCMLVTSSFNISIAHWPKPHSHILE